MDSFIENLRKEAQCSLCKNTLVEPTTVPCLHTFCKHCIKEHAKPKDHLNVFECPSCNSQTILREFCENEDLKTSNLHSRILKVLEIVEREKICSVSAEHLPALWLCFDCDKSLCEDCYKWHTTFIKNHKVALLSDFERENLEEILRKEPPCDSHKNAILESFCKRCQVLVCCLCLKDNHRDHETMTLQEFKTDKKALLSSAIEDIEGLRTREKEKEVQKTIAMKIVSSGEKSKEEVKKRIKELVKNLLDKQDQLLNEIQNSVDRAEMNLRIINHPLVVLHHIRNIIEHGSAADMNGCCTDNGEEKTLLTYSPFKDNVAGIKFEPDKNLINDCQLGVRFTELSSCAVSEINGYRLYDATSCQKAAFTVHLRHLSGQPNCDDTDDVEIQFTPEDGVKHVERRKTSDDKLEIEFIPRVSGQLKVEVKLNGHNISNSPIKIDVKSQEIVKSHLNSCLEEGFNAIKGRWTGIAVSKSKRKIAIVDGSTHCVRVFSSSGELLMVYGSKGSHENQLSSPSGVDFLNEEDVVVVDSGNNRVCIVNTTKSTMGSLVKTFGCRGEGNGQFKYPKAVHVDDDCNIIVTDTGNNNVQVFTKDGEYQHKICFPRRDFSPKGAVRHNGMFYIANERQGIDVVQVNDNSEAILVSTIVFREGVAAQNLPFRIGGIALDDDYNLVIFVSEKDGDNSVHKYSLDGHLIGRSRRSSRDSDTVLRRIQDISKSVNDGEIICIATRDKIFSLRQTVSHY